MLFVSNPISMPYDQKEVLASNKLYLCRSLKLEDIEVRQKLRMRVHAAFL
jgi:hypothetical protein